ncbi:hypothetical protein PGB90_000721 [Kerria lacca]
MLSSDYMLYRLTRDFLSPNFVVRAATSSHCCPTVVVASCSVNAPIYLQPSWSRRSKVA